MNLSDYRSILDGFLESCTSDSLPPHHFVRYLMEWWPDIVRVAWAKRVALLEQSGIEWRQAEWESFQFIVKDTKRHDEQNPTRKIQWKYPSKSEISDIDEHKQIKADENFIFNFQAGVTYNASLGMNAVQIHEELERKIKETEIALKEQLKLEKETTVKKRSSIKKEPKAHKDKKPSQSGNKKSKFDPGMGALFS
jgi:hypothetical protein